jgi:ribose transport system permease protein
VNTSVSGDTLKIPEASGSENGVAPKRTSHKSWFERLWLDRLSVVYLFVIFIIIYSLVIPGEFWTELTWQSTFSQGVVTAVVALAFLIPMTAGSFDLSVGAMLGFSLVIAAWLPVNTSLPSGVAAVVAIAACALIGAINGFVVVRLRVASFIATLGMTQILTAAVIFISSDSPITNAFSNSFTEWGRKNIFGVPIVVVYLAVLVVIVWYVLDHTPAGRALYATGGNPDAARLAGVRTDATVFWSLVAGASLAGLAGVIYAMQVGTFAVSDGPGYLFPAATAVLFGASQFSKRPNVWGTILALYALAFGVEGLQLIDSNGGYWIAPLFEGVALIAAVAVSARAGVIGLGSRRERSGASSTTGEGS